MEWVRRVKGVNCMLRWMVTRIEVLITLKYIQMLNYNAVCLKHIKTKQKIYII